MSAPDPVSLSTADACRALGVSRRTLSRLIAAGSIQARQMPAAPGARGGHLLIDAASVRTYYEGLPLVGAAPARKRFRAKRAA
jgi:excisionase family DNA binding protein